MAQSSAHGDIGRPPQRTLSVKLREIHGYLGMLIGPLVLFLAVTGLLQVFSLHEAHGGYTPYPLIEKLGKVHKDQSFELGKKRPAPAPVAAGASAVGAAEVAAGQALDHDDDHDHDHDHAQTNKSMLPVYLLKWYFALVAVGLFSSTLIGIWIALRNPLRRKTYVVLLIIGIVLPAVLVAATS